MIIDGGGGGCGGGGGDANIDHVCGISAYEPEWKKKKKISLEFHFGSQSHSCNIYCDKQPSPLLLID
ncbi:hypothetical protein DERF_008303 [Dermatophagoides farinae]|uniref:Uncharacterized protein n=1 Tax=Dermatophagoides farinae TaxID=6954 RepID=A0A922I5E1_DERFA|nr:hypothetical protein DERF_008303 [Dermatophagoides farinae]